MSVQCSVGGAALQNQSLHNVFVYGSLLADEVVQVLLKRVPPSTLATLPDQFVSLSLSPSLSSILLTILKPYDRTPSFQSQ